MSRSALVTACNDYVAAELRSEADVAGDKEAQELGRDLDCFNTQLSNGGAHIPDGRAVGVGVGVRGCGCGCEAWEWEWERAWAWAY